MKSSKILESAKAQLPDSFEFKHDNRVSPYICDHIMEVGYDHNQVAKARQIKNKISELIGDQFSLADWVISQGYATSEEIYGNPKKMQQTRKNFIDDLIKYYKQQGD